MMVDADNFALCMIIWGLKDWITSKDDWSYPLICRKDMCSCCLCYCSNLLHAMRTDDTLDKFFQDQGIDKYINDLDGYQALERAKDHMETFCGNLLAGKEIISGSNRTSSLLAAIQLQKILQELDFTLGCIKEEINGRDSDDSESESLANLAEYCKL